MVYDPNEMVMMANKYIPPFLAQQTNVIIPTEDGKYTASNIVISRNADYYMPVDVTATSAEFSYKPSVYANSLGRWEAMMLPFASDNVSSTSKKLIKPYTTTADGDFVVKYTSDNGAKIEFALPETDIINAHEPFIIAIPETMSGDEIKFGASDVLIGSTTQKTVSGTLNGTFEKIPYSENDVLYVLNSAGTEFELLTKGSIAPFGAFFTKLLPAKAQTSVLAIAEPIVGKETPGDLTSIGETDAKTISIYAYDGDIFITTGEDEIITIFSSMGATVKTVECKAGETYKISNLPQGIYIVKGKKIVI